MRGAQEAAQAAEAPGCRAGGLAAAAPPAALPDLHQQGAQGLGLRVQGSNLGAVQWQRHPSRSLIFTNRVPWVQDSGFEG